MTLKTISEKAKTFTFTHSFADHQTAQTAGHALMGYMLGTARDRGYHRKPVQTEACATTKKIRKL